MPNLKDAALEYARRGWPIFPCRSDKAPYTERGVLEATTNERVISAWWDEFPRAGIGLDVGGAGMVALDLDPGHDLPELEEKIGGLETDLVSRTPRGGEHWFFLKDRDEVIPPSAGKVAKHVDVRSYHSYVILPPSTSRDGTYEWISEGRARRRPDALIEIAGEARLRHSEADEWIIEPDLEDNAALAIAYLKSEAQVAIEGLNGDTMAYRTAAMCRSFGLSPELAFDLVWQFWNPRCIPPWSADEAEHLEVKIKNAYRYATSPPGNLTPAYRVAKQQALFTAVSRDTDSGGRTAEAGRFRFVDEAGIADIKPPEWLIDNCIPRGSYSLLIGNRGSYKTFIALDMALSIACGGAAWYDSEEDWFGAWGAVLTGPVLFAAGEGRAGLKARVEAWRQLHLGGSATGNFYLADPVPHPTEDDATAFIEGALALSPDGYELVVLDTVGRSMQGLNESSQQDASRFTLLVQTLQHELNCTVLALHHTGHESVDRARGSTVFGADDDTEFIIERVSTEFSRAVRLRMTKQKDAPEWEEPRILELRKYGDSLVAVKADGASSKAAMEAPVEKPGLSNGQRKGGRRTKEALDVELSVIRKAAYAVMKKYPGKEWSRLALASAIAADVRVSVKASTIRNRYLDELLTDKNHPVASCYDVGKQVWMYKHEVS